MTEYRKPYGLQEPNGEQTHLDVSGINYKHIPALLRINQAKCLTITAIFVAF